MNKTAELYNKICDRAKNMGLYNGKRICLLFDIESADLKFHLRLEEWLNADDSNFAHDLLGIMDNIVREDLPSDNFGDFVPRFAGVTE